MSIESERPGGDGLKDFRGPEPAKDEDAKPTPPVADDDGAPPPTGEDVKVAGVDTAKKDEPPAPPPAPKLSPADEARAKIAERFAKKRITETDPTDLDPTNPQTLYGRLAGDPPPDDSGDKPDPLKAPATPGPSDSGDKPEPLTLAVNGKTIAKTLAEVAALADMTEDEAKANPARAKKYAQMSLAHAENLEWSKNLRRETPSRRPDEAGTRPASPGPTPGPKEAGDDDRDQPSASRDTSDEEVAKLIEDIQIGDPKEVGPKLKEFIAKAAGDTAKTALQASEGDRLRQGELQSLTSAVKEFTDAHPEVLGKPSIAAAIKAGLVDEYRTDLRAALVNEGDSEEAADEILAQATDDQIRDAHLTRRLNRNPHVRKIDKAMIEQTWDRVRSDFGATGPAPQQQQQNLSRQERKEALPVQPRRASVPPATPAQPAQPISRKSAVAEMAARTGRKPASLSR